MKTEALRQALDKYGFDAAFGGARRDEEKSRAKERIFSFRSAGHRWDPRQQRPELWALYNTRKRPGESLRVFPLSNWTELDVWLYIWREEIPIVPLYFAAERPVVERGGALIVVDDERMPLEPSERPAPRRVRFRTLGCYPLTAAIESEADTLSAIIRETLLSRSSERRGRVIDPDAAASLGAPAEQRLADDGGQRIRLALDGGGERVAAERAKAHSSRRRPLAWLERHALIVHHDERPAALDHRALRREVQRHDRDLLPPDVQPHIELGPVGQRKHAQALARALAGVVERPELRALLPRVPAMSGGAEREDALLGAALFLVAARAAECCIEAVLVERLA